MHFSATYLLAFDELKDDLRMVSNQLRLAAEAEKQWTYECNAGDLEVVWISRSSMSRSMSITQPCFARCCCNPQISPAEFERRSTHAA
jgi:hypothetical protein